MKVDPSDSSYMPSVVVISAGDSIQSLKEIKTVHISATDSLCTLLEDAQEVSGGSSMCRVASSCIVKDNITKTCHLPGIM